MSDPNQANDGFLTDPRLHGPQAMTALEEPAIPPSGLGGPGRLEEPEVTLQSVISLEDLARYLRRYWKPSLWISGVLSFLVLIALIGSTPLFTSKTHLEVEMTAENDRLFDRTVMPENFPMFLMNTHKVGLQTRAYQEYFFGRLERKDQDDFLLDEGFKKPWLASTLGSIKGSVRGMIDPLLMLVGLKEAEEESEGARKDAFVRKLNEGAIRLSEIKESHLIRISAAGPNRDLVARLANLYGEYYVDYLGHREREEAREEYDFLRQVEEQHRATAMGSREALNRFRLKHELVGDLDTDGMGNSHETQKLNEERATIRVSYTKAEAVLQQVEEMRKAGKTLFGIREIAEAPTVKDLYKDLVKAQQTYQTSMSLYGEIHLSVKRSREEVRSLESLLDQEMQRVVGQFEETFANAEEKLASLERELHRVLEHRAEHEEQTSELRVLIAQANSDQETHEAILKKVNQAKLETELPTTSQVRIVDIATPADEPYKPNKPLSLVLAGLLFVGLFLGIPTTLGIGDDLSRRYGIRVPLAHRNLPEEVGAIPQVKVVGNLTMLSEAFRRGPAREALFKLASSIERRAPKDGAVLLFTSALAGEGKSFLAATLGGVFGSQGKKTLLIDCNLRNPSSREWFPVSDTSTNLTEWLEDGGSVKEVCYQRFGRSDLHILGADGWTLNPMGLLGKAKFRELLEKAKEEFSVVILDGPTAEEAAESEILTEVASEILLVSDCQRSSYSDMAEAHRSLRENAGETPIGVVANRS